MKKKYFVHDTACTDKNVKIGINTKIWHWSHISKNVKIGKKLCYRSKCVCGK